MKGLRGPHIVQGHQPGTGMRAQTSLRSLVDLPYKLERTGEETFTGLGSLTSIGMLLGLP